jgi:hypothetical protein
MGEGVQRNGHKLALKFWKEKVIVFGETIRKYFTNR